MFDEFDFTLNLNNFGYTGAALAQTDALLKAWSAQSQCMKWCNFDFFGLNNSGSFNFNFNFGFNPNISIFPTFNASNSNSWFDNLSLSNNTSYSLLTPPSNVQALNFFGTKKLEEPKKIEKYEPKKKVPEKPRTVASSDKPVDNRYASMTKAEAEKAAAKDPKLEKLTGGTRWSLSKSSFVHDIPYATKGTSAVLDMVSETIGQDLIITSALGTKHGPHVKTGYECHSNSDNVKLDISLRNISNPDKLVASLKATGCFSRVSKESDHLDVQIDINKLREYA